MRKDKPTAKELFENKFLYNDSIPATAAKVLLGLLIAGPVLVAGAAVPGLLREASRFEKRKRYSKKQWQNAYKNLKYRKLIEIIQEGDEKFKVQLTNKGQKRVKEFFFEFLEIKKPKRWDGKWRVLVFDIPSKPKIYNQARNAMRNKIKDLGFFQMQKSVWVYPYECEDEILFVAELFQVQKHIEILTVEKLLHEEKIKREFGL
jgi:DNA-binding transcriptional regulator PaaX